MKKTTFSARGRRSLLHLIRRRQCLSADDLSVFSSALRPCLRFLAAVIVSALGLSVFLKPTPAYAANASITLTVPKTLSVQVEPGKGMKTGTGKVSIQSDAQYGYTLGIKAKASGTELKSAENNTIASMSSNNNTIPVGSWGWRYGEGTTDPGSESFKPSPTTADTSIASLSASTGGVNKDYYLTVGANVSADQATGTYTKDFVLTATAKPKEFTINYNVNGGTTVTAGSGSTYTNTATFNTKAAPTRSNYTFKGWCPKETTSASCSVTACSAGGSCSVAIDSSNTNASTGVVTIQLYAMWQANGKTINQITYMQDYGDLDATGKASVRDSMILNQQYELTDKRDNRKYYVAKLADGNVWMTENLDLNLSTSKALTPNDTDIPANWTPSNSTFVSTETGYWEDKFDVPYTWDPGDRCWIGEISDTDYTISNNAIARNCNKHDDSHYYVGNYYNWPAAVATNDASGYNMDIQDTDQSICPKGWRLPTYDGDKSLPNLQLKSGFINYKVGTNLIHQAPYFFTYTSTGNSSGVGKIGTHGRFWSSVAGSAKSAYYFFFDSAGGSSSQLYKHENRYGYPVRCVARTDDNPPGSAKNYTIKYNTDGGSTVNPEYRTTYGSTTKLSYTMKAAPTKAEYTFKGWCSKETTNYGRTCTGTTYQPNTTYDLAWTGGTAKVTTVNLYAIWDSGLGINTMQEIGSLSSTTKNSMPVGQQYTLIDTRDDRKYYVSKLADNNIWMTENLDLDLSTDTTLTTANTDIKSSWTPSNSTITASNLSTTTWPNMNNVPYSLDPGDRCWNGSIALSSAFVLDDENAKDCRKHDSTHYYVGNYYNWPAAVATNDASGYNMDIQDTDQSICPKGWRLPTYDGDKSLNNLRNKTNFVAGRSGNNLIHEFPYFFTYTSSGSSNEFAKIGTHGRFWSSIAKNNTTAYYFFFDLNGVTSTPLYSYDKRFGYPVRCVAR